ncbi:HET-domain-containing protein [Xylaria acuta]|nr:HET-domain-containing protein [Xylaria acuta]
MTSLYQYLPLRTRHSIRVLELSPSHFGEPHIHCKIRYTHIGAARDTFEALSYTWGDPTPCRTIYCDESNAGLEVPLNCYIALRHLRDTKATRTLWIDAICINQHDEQERNSQVKIMGEIYSAAGNTIVFLGDSTPGSQTLFRHLARTDRHMSFGHGSESLRKPRKEIISELENLFKRTWFSRVWVIQELLKSSRVTFMCGRDTATLKALQSCLYRHQQNKRAFAIIPVPLQLYDDHFKCLLEEKLTPFQRLYLFTVGADSCESTDTRDRIIALTPLIAVQPPELQNLINYDQSVNELFHKLALLFLSEGGLAILWMIRHPRPEDRSEERLPSWVPDWAEGKGRSYRLQQIPDFFSVYRLSRDFRDFYVDSAKRLLVIRGVRYGYVHELGPVIRISQEDVQTRIEAVRALVADLYAMVNGNALPGWPHSIIHDEESTSNIAVGWNDTRVFINSNGVLGRCPKEAQRGDLVVLVNGALEPCILRERDDNQWTIISGNCVLLDIELSFMERGRLWPWLYVYHNFWGEEKFTIC